MAPLPKTLRKLQTPVKEWAVGEEEAKAYFCGVPL